MPRKIRLIVATLFFIAVTALFLDFTGTVHSWLGWTAKIQFLPALLALNIGIVVLLILITLLVGRVYCSVICPLGVFQDIVSWISGRRKNKKYRFSYSPEVKWLRYGMLGLFIIAMIFGINSFVALLAPYSSYGRIVSNLFAPIYRWGHNLFANFSERADRSLPTFIIAAVTCIALVTLAWRNGRTYCNTICPVGTILGFFSRFSLFRPVIDVEKCTNCSLCSRGCKAACIDYKNHKIDYSRCVACMDCLEICKHDALHLQFRLKKRNQRKAGSMQQTSAEQINITRRSFLSATAVLVTTSALKAENRKVKERLAIIGDKKIPVRATPIVPPGAWSARNFASHCTACQLCVSVCPNNVLRPSTELTKLMQPEMYYERGYCHPECTRCSDVCPTGAIRPITIEEKSSTRIGHAVWIQKNCMPLTDGVECGECARHCPSGAILMVPSDTNDVNSVRIPVVHAELCTGCGACENFCPARPFRAIYVEGHERHSIM